jgi:hypothetical protein
MNFFKEKKSTTQRDPKEERVIKSKKKKKDISPQKLTRQTHGLSHEIAITQ